MALGDHPLHPGHVEFWDGFRPGDLIVHRPTRREYKVQDPAFTSRGKLRYRRTGSNARSVGTAWWPRPGALPASYYAIRPVSTG